MGMVVCPYPVNGTPMKITRLASLAMISIYGVAGQVILCMTLGFS